MSTFPILYHYVKTNYLYFIFILVFFFFFGETLLLLTFNYNSISDTIPSAYFLLVKTHVIFFTTTSSQYLGETIFMYIVFFTTASIKFLTNLRYTFDYHYLKYLAHWDFVFLAIIFYLFIAGGSKLVFLIASILFYFFTVRFFNKDAKVSY